MNSPLLKKFSLLLLICAGLFFFGNNFLTLTDPDEVFYSLSAKEMVQRNEWLTPYIFDHPQFEKPILTYWFIKVAFATFGQTPFAARFFPAVFATFGVLAVYSLGLLGFINERRAFLAALILATSGLYTAMGKTVFTDMIFSVLILYALLSFYLAYSNPAFKRGGILTFYLFGALAVLTKGPLGLFIPEAVVFVFLLYRRELSFLKTPWFFIGFLISLLVAVPWYWYEIQQYGQAFIHEFFYNDHWRRVIEAEHKGNDKWYFYPLTMVGGLFPWSIFLMAAFKDLYKKLKYPVKPFEYFILSWILVVFLVFQFAHSKLASYILPVFPALALLTANYIDEKIEEYHNETLKKLAYILIVILVVIGIGVLVAHKAYQTYVPTLAPAYWLSASLLTLSGISLVLLFKERIRAALTLLAFSLVPFFLTAYMIAPYIEPHISMSEATSYIPSVPTNRTILTAKIYARGVAYYTQKNVAVLDLGGQNYFSPHPIPYLNTKEKLDLFLTSQRQTFAILKKSGYEYLKSNYSRDFRIIILKKSGPNYILKIEPLKTA